MTANPFDPMPENTFHLPIEMAVIVPSTTEYSKPISSEEFEARTKEIRNLLTKLFGGNTQIKAVGGFQLKGKEIREKVNMVYSYSKRADWMKNRKKLLEYLQQKKKEYKQQSLGIIFETDLFYI